MYLHIHTDSHTADHTYHIINKEMGKQDNEFKVISCIKL